MVLLIEPAERLTPVYGVDANACVRLEDRAWAQLKISSAAMADKHKGDSKPDPNKHQPSALKESLQIAISNLTVSTIQVVF